MGLQFFNKSFIIEETILDNHSDYIDNFVELYIIDKLWWKTKNIKSIFQEFKGVAFNLMTLFADSSTVFV